jgi:hypothetical protein
MADNALVRIPRANELVQIAGHLYRAGKNIRDFRNIVRNNPNALQPYREAAQQVVDTAAGIYNWNPWSYVLGENPPPRSRKPLKKKAVKSKRKPMPARRGYRGSARGRRAARGRRPSKRKQSSKKKLTYGSRSKRNRVLDVNGLRKPTVRKMPAVPFPTQALCKHTLYLDTERVVGPNARQHGWTTNNLTFTKTTNQWSQVAVISLNNPKQPLEHSGTDSTVSPGLTHHDNITVAPKWFPEMDANYDRCIVHRCRVTFIVERMTSKTDTETGNVYMWLRPMNGDAYHSEDNQLGFLADTTQGRFIGHGLQDTEDLRNNRMTYKKLKRSGKTVMSFEYDPYRVFDTFQDFHVSKNDYKDDMTYHYEDNTPPQETCTVTCGLTAQNGALDVSASDGSFITAGWLADEKFRVQVMVTYKTQWKRHDISASAHAQVDFE